MNPHTTEHQTSAVVLTSVSFPSAWDREGRADLEIFLYCEARSAEWHQHFRIIKRIMYLSEYTVCVFKTGTESLWDIFLLSPHESYSNNMHPSHQLQQVEATNYSQRDSGL